MGKQWKQCQTFGIKTARRNINNLRYSDDTNLMAEKRRRIKEPLDESELPLLGLLMPGIFNAFLVGWELTVYIGGGFWINALYVAIGEWIVMLTLGAVLYSAIRVRNLDVKLFQ